MTPKEYLQQYRESMARTDEITAHLDELKAECIKLRDHTGERIALDAAVEKYVDACEDAGAELNRLAALRGEITETIEAVQDMKLRTLLVEIYISGKKIVRVAADRDQSYEHICRLHGEALQAVRTVMPQT